MTKESWPAWYFGPNGERAIFQEAAQVPDDWTDKPQGGLEPFDASVLRAADAPTQQKFFPEMTKPKPKASSGCVEPCNEAATKLYEDNTRAGLIDMAKEAGIDLPAKPNKMEVANLIAQKEESEADDNSE